MYSSHGSYASASRWVNLALGALDRLLSGTPPQRAVGEIAAPRRLLLACTGHLGDVVLATAVLPVLRHAFPTCRIGFLVGSWARPVLDRHPLVNWLHHFDHWKLNRAASTWSQKLWRHLRTRRRALREIRSLGYDAAIDLRYYFGNAIPLLWQAGIPVRIGYTSGGFGPLLTHPVSWRIRECHVVDYLADLARVLPINERDMTRLQPVLPPDPDSPALPGCVEGLGRRRTPYVVAHMGSGARFKEWPGPKWRALTQRLTREGWTLLLTGSTRSEGEAAERVAAGLAGCINACGQLNWSQFVAVVRQARLVIGVDSVAGHIAAAVGTPCVVIGNGITHPAHWKPRSPHSRVLLQPVACAPCYRPRGCAGMECVRHVSVDDAWGAIQDLLHASELRAV